MELTQLPVQACGALPDGDGRKGYPGYTVNYQFIYGRAAECGFPASTVTLTPPAPDQLSDASRTTIVISTPLFRAVGGGSVHYCCHAH